MKPKQAIRMLTGVVLLALFREKIGLKAFLGRTIYMEKKLKVSLRWVALLYAKTKGLPEEKKNAETRSESGLRISA